MWLMFSSLLFSASISAFEGFYTALCLTDNYRAILYRLKNLEEEEARLEATGAYAPEEDDEGNSTFTPLCL